MRVSALFSALFALAVSSASSAKATKPTPAPAPTFETLFVGTLDAAAPGMIEGPYGTRLYAPINGGNLTDTSGKLVATILPSKESGIISSTGTFYPEVIITLQWAVDQKYAYLNGVGVGNFGVGDLNYIHLETDSDTYSSLNDRFILAQVTNGPTTTVTIFGAK